MCIITVVFTNKYVELSFVQLLNLFGRLTDAIPFLCEEGYTDQQLITVHN